MIEIEKKFAITEEQRAALVARAELVSQKKIRDIYYDSADYVLTRKDWWLRERDGAFELKTVVVSADRSVDRYEETVDEPGIRQRLGLSGVSDLKTDLASAGIVPFVDLVTTRTKYKSGDFLIDMDELDYGYALIEIELMVTNEDLVAAAAERIRAFATEVGLDQSPVRGKVVEYLRRHRPEHYHALQDAGVLKGRE